MYIPMMHDIIEKYTSLLGTSRMICVIEKLNIATDMVSCVIYFIKCESVVRLKQHDCHFSFWSSGSIYMWIL
jgi:hypothetical protein